MLKYFLIFMPFHFFQSNIFAQEIKNTTYLELNNIKINLNVDEKKQNIIVKASEELNAKNYFAAIRMLDSYLDAQREKGSANLSDMMGSAPLRDANLILAIAYLNTGNEERAVPILNNLILYSDKWEAIYIVLCEYYLKKNAFLLVKNVALKGIDKLVVPPISLSVYLAQAQLGLNDVIGADKTLEQAHLIFPQDAFVVGWQGVVNLKKNKVLQACAQFKLSYLAGAQTSSFIGYYHASCLLQSHDYEGAASVVKIGLINFPSNANFYYLGGVLSDVQHQFLDAKKYWGIFSQLAEPTDGRLPYVKIALAKMH